MRPCPCCSGFAQIGISKIRLVWPSSGLHVGVLFLGMPPFLGDLPRLPEDREQASIQAFVPNMAIEGFLKPILRGLTRLDKLQGDTIPLRPSEHGHGGEPSPVIADKKLWSAMQIDQSVQLLAHASRRSGYPPRPYGIS